MTVFKWRGYKNVDYIQSHREVLHEIEIILHYGIRNNISDCFICYQDNLHINGASIIYIEDTRSEKEQCSSVYETRTQRVTYAIAYITISMK